VNIHERIRNDGLHGRIITAEAAANMFEDGMVVGVSGFTPSGYPKAIPLALAQRVRRSGEKLKLTLLTGASVGDELDGAWTEAGIISKRAPYQTNGACRESLNTSGGIEYIDMHLSRAPKEVRSGLFGPMDYAVIEACAITEDGDIVPTTAVGNSPAYVQYAKKVLVEINTSQPLALEGMHDIYVPRDPPDTAPIPLCSAGGRIGAPHIVCGPGKIAGIVITDIPDNTRGFYAVEEIHRAMARNLLDFLRGEVKAGRLGPKLHPLQSGVGSAANAVLAGIGDSEFRGLEFYSEVIQDSALDLLDRGTFSICSGTAVSPSPGRLKDFYENIDKYRDKIILRPQEISNSGEVVARLGVISMNTAIEADIYGNVNSSHIMGTRMMNGIGGSGDFARNASISIFLTPSTASGGKISCIVPMCSHIDHTEHDVGVIITERGAADIRGASPRERAPLIINNCAHPDYRDALLDYYRRALTGAHAGKAHTPHLMGEALSWHQRFNDTGSMKTH